jgi:hypothetical protein
MPAVHPNLLAFGGAPADLLHAACLIVVLRFLVALECGETHPAATLRALGALRLESAATLDGLDTHGLLATAALGGLRALGLLPTAALARLGGFVALAATMAAPFSTGRGCDR